MTYAYAFVFDGWDDGICYDVVANILSLYDHRERKPERISRYINHPSSLHPSPIHPTNNPHNNTSHQIHSNH